jgi:nucleoside-diphosphate-sugar epimerase
MRNNQIILGAGGSFGKVLASELKKYTNSIYLFSRNPMKVNIEDNLIKGNLLNAIQTENALENMDVAYLVVGIEYNTKIWERDWLNIVKNVVEGCKKHNVALVFLDNVYMYDPNNFNNLTEETSNKIVSRKGAVRVAIANLLMEEIQKRVINIQIVRSADFYGKGVENSMFNEVVVKNILANKKVNWFIDANKKHALTLVDDAAKATALLGNTNSAYNQIWHLPTDKAYTANELIQKISSITGKPAKIQIASRFLTTILALFVSPIKESKELLYQFDRDYEFNSKKFETTFGILPTSIDEGLAAIFKYNV